MQDQSTLKATTKPKQTSTKQTYSKPRITVLGKANELTLANEVGKCLDNVVPGGLTDTCS